MNEKYPKRIDIFSRLATIKEEEEKERKTILPKTSVLIYTGKNKWNSMELYEKKCISGDYCLSLSKI